MSEYINFILIWLGFMVLIGLSTVFLPKIAAAVDKWLKDKKLPKFEKKDRKGVYSPITEDELEEKNNKNGD